MLDRLEEEMPHKDNSLASMPRAPRDQVVIWLRDTFCLSTRSSLPKQVVYDEYCNYCRRNGWDPASTASCGRLVHQAFPDVTCSRKGGRGMSAYHYGNLAWAKQKTNGGSGRRRLQSHTSSALSWPMSATQQYSYNKEDAMDTETDSPSQFGHPEQLHKVCSDGDAPFYRPQPRHHKEISPPTSQTSRRSSSSYFSPPMHNGYTTTTTTTTTTISEDTLGAIIENYYQDLLFALLQGNEPLAKEVLQRFWREEVCYELERRSVREIMQSEQKGAVNLMEKLIANPTGMSPLQLSDYLTILATQLPLWVQAESMNVLPYQAFAEQKAFWANVSGVVKAWAKGLRGEPGTNGNDVRVHNGNGDYTFLL